MKVKALGSINSGQYDKGDVFDATEQDAERLLASGVVCVVEGFAPEVSPPRKKEEGLVKKAKKAKGGKR